MIRTQKFVIGMTVLLAALGLMAWGFSKSCLEPHQYWLLHAIIPLAGGFIAWSFHGALNMHVTNSVWEGFTVGAVGGFGVFLIMLHVLEPPRTSGCSTPRPSSSIRFQELRTEVINLISEYNNQRSRPDLLADTRRRGRQLGADLLQVSRDDLSPAEIVALRLNSSAAYLISGMAEDLMKAPDKRFVLECADVAVEQAHMGLQIIEDTHEAEFVKFVRGDFIRDRLSFTLAASLALQAKYRGQDPDLVLAALRNMDRGFRTKSNIKGEPVLASFCEKFKAQEQWRLACS
jgi:hypothetical protein